MNPTLAIFVMVFATILAALGQICLKMGSMKLKINIASLIRNYILITGVFFYGASSLVSIIALRGGELSILYPIASLNYVWVSFLSMKYLKEKMNSYKWGGILLIILGVIIII